MDQRPNVVIVLARCGKEKKSFGLRFEETTPGTWTADWAFAIPEAQAQREGYDLGEIKGNFAFASTYPGCPHCGGQSVLKCSCGKVSCWDGQQKKIICPWCGAQGEIKGKVDSLRSGGV